MGKEWMEPYNDQFYNEGLTTGCGNNNGLLYCPERSVTLAEMATFIDKAFNIHLDGYEALNRRYHAINRLLFDGISK